MTYLRMDRSRALQWMQEAQNRLAPGVRYSEESQRRAAEALGVLDKLPDPQAELLLSASQATRPATVTPSPDPQAPSVRRSA